MNHRRGFTLIELLVVIGVLAVLMALSIPALLASWHQNKVKATRRVIGIVETKIIKDKAETGSLTLEFTDATGQARIARKWDFNGDGLLDGDPDVVFEPEWRDNAGRITSTITGVYRGFLGTLGGDFGKTFVDRQRGEVVDNFHQVLRIDFSPTDYGVAGFRVFSIGKDGIAGTEDDIYFLEDEQ